MPTETPDVADPYCYCCEGTGKCTWHGPMYGKECYCLTAPKDGEPQPEE